MTEGLQVEYRAPSELVRYERNARTHSAEQVEKVAASIREFGFTNPILIGDDDTIIAGHGRLAAAESLGLDRVPTIRLAHLTEEQRRAYVLADNRLAEDAGWDDELLALELGELAAGSMDMALTGFGEEEIASMLHAAAATPGLTDPDVAPSRPRSPVTERGDLWRAGEHLVGCADACDETAVRALLGGSRTQLMVSTAPEGSAGAFRLFPGDVAYVWQVGGLPGEVASALEAAGYEVRGQIVWDAGAPRDGPRHGQYRTQHEVCWYAVRRGRTAGWRGDRKQSTVWRATAPECGAEYPREKPVALIERAVLNSSATGQTVYDCALGAGCTLVAAEITGRRLCALEADPALVDVAIRRWEAFTGRDAERLSGALQEADCVEG